MNFLYSWEASCLSQIKEYFNIIAHINILIVNAVCALTCGLSYIVYGHFSYKLVLCLLLYAVIQSVGYQLGRTLLAYSMQTCPNIYMLSSIPVCVSCFVFFLRIIVIVVIWLCFVVKEFARHMQEREARRRYEQTQFVGGSTHHTSHSDPTHPAHPPAPQHNYAELEMGRLPPEATTDDYQHLSEVWSHCQYVSYTIMNSLLL